MNNKLKQINRISHMERCFDNALNALERLQSAIANYETVENEIKELEKYYSGSQWRRDLIDDEAGRLPEDLKRGVLSEDGVWNMLELHDSLLYKMAELSKKADS